MKKKTITKLSLNRETIRQLNMDEIDKVAAAGRTDITCFISCATLPGSRCISCEWC